MAYCCESLTGISVGCDLGVGGIKRVLGACYGDITSVTAADGVITAIAPTTGATWHEYTPRPETSSLNQSLVSDRPNGLVLWDVSLTLVWGIWDVTKMVEARALALSDTVWMVEDNNGNWWYIGYDRPAYMSEADITTGTALDDPINYTLTILNRSNEPVYRVDEKVIEAVLGK